MTKTKSVLYVFMFVYFIVSCTQNRVLTVSKEYIDIVIYIKGVNVYVLLGTNDLSVDDLLEYNYLKVEISGGVVPSNHLAIFRDTSSGKTWVGYSGDVLEVNLDSNFVYHENKYSMCYDRENRVRRNCLDFDLFYEINGRYR